MPDGQFKPQKVHERADVQRIAIRRFNPRQLGANRQRYECGSKY